MRFHIKGNMKDAEWVCNEIMSYMKKSWKARFITSAKILSKGEDMLVFEVNTRPAMMLKHAQGGRDILTTLMTGMLLEKAPGAFIEKVEV